MMFVLPEFWRVSDCVRIRTAMDRGRTSCAEIYDDGYRKIATVRAGNGYSADEHELKLTAAGTALITIATPVTYDLRSVGGSGDRQRVYLAKLTWAKK